MSDVNGRFQLPRLPATARITAAKEGYFIAGAPAADNPVIRLSRLPERDCESYAWRNPAPDPARPLNCGNCHAAIHDEWARSGHAHASTNKHFLNLYDGKDAHGRPDRGWSLLREHPDGAGVCAACHAPTARPNPQEDFDLRTAVKGLGELGGVHCDFCHKIQGPGRGTLGLTHGRYQLEFLRPEKAERSPHGDLVFGPLDDVDRGDDAFSRFQRDSRLCAACHEGVVFGVPVYTTYSEWLASPARRAGRSCQSCHMAPTGKMTNIAPGHGGIERDAMTLGNHRFFAGSQLDMLRRCLKLTATAERTRHGLRVDIALSVDGVGHRVPTGFVDRQLILVVEPIGGTPNRALLAGPTLPDTAGSALAGRPGRLYAKVLRDGDGRSPAPFWRADPDYLLDTRLTPGETDSISWLFAQGTEGVRVRVLHCRFWQVVADMKGWPDNETSILERWLAP
jgi:hypothetical protein